MRKKQIILTLASLALLVSMQLFPEEILIKLMLTASVVYFMVTMLLWDPGYSKENIEKYESRLRGSLPENSKEDILELMLTNMIELKEYYELSKSHARNAFLLAVSMCILGFALLSTAVALSYIGKQPDWVVSVGGIIIEVIAGTSLIVYRKSLTQLNFYYNALHENERFLSMVNLVSKISQEKQDDVYVKIIESQIQILSKNEVINTSSQ